VATPPSGGNSTTSQEGLTYASPSGYADGGTPTVLACVTLNAGGTYEMWNFISGGALSLTPSSIVIPVSTYDVPYYYTVYYL
jgi:hypothetical protein